jgi:hypothetical protein
MENHNFSWVNQLPMTIFNSYVSIILPGATEAFLGMAESPFASFCHRAS